jgi:hypothetical protein
MMPSRRSADCPDQHCPTLRVQVVERVQQFSADLEELGVSVEEHGNAIESTAGQARRQPPHPTPPFYYSPYRVSYNSLNTFSKRASSVRCPAVPLLRMDKTLRAHHVRLRDG